MMMAIIVFTLTFGSLGAGGMECLPSMYPVWSSLPSLLAGEKGVEWYPLLTTSLWPSAADPSRYTATPDVLPYIYSSQGDVVLNMLTLMRIYSVGVYFGGMGCVQPDIHSDALFLPYGEVSARVEVGGGASFGFRIGRRVSLGIGGSIFYRYDYQEPFTTLDILSAMDDLEGELRRDIEGMWRGVIRLSILGALGRGWSGYLVVSELPVYGEGKANELLGVYREWGRLAFGVEQDLELGFPWGTRIGASLDLGMLRLEAGLHQGYPVCGVGLNLWRIHLYGAYFAREGGGFIGADRDDYYSVSLWFR